MIEVIHAAAAARFQSTRTPDVAPVAPTAYTMLNEQTLECTTKRIKYTE